MRIAFDGRNASRGLGQSTFIVALATELVASGKVELVWLGDPGTAPRGVAGVVRVDRLPYPALDGALGRALARRLGVELIHFTGNTGWGRHGPLPSVLTLHDLIFLSTGVRARSLRQVVGHRYERRLIGHAVRSASILAVPSRTVANEVMARFPGIAAPEVVHEGVDVPPVPAPSSAAVRAGASSAARAAAAARGGNCRAYLLAFAGRDPRKRTAEVVAGWRALSGLPVHLRLIGSGGVPPELRASLATELQDGRVRILERLPRAELWRELAGALALAYPSSAEGFGLPVLEGLAAGVPVLSGLAPVTREIGSDAIVPLDERDIPGSIAAAVARLYTDRGFAERVIARGRERAAQFTWSRTARRYVELYRLALERTR